MQTIQYYQIAPAVHLVQTSFTVVNTVTSDQWNAWTDQITKTTLWYPDGTSEDLTAGQYQIDNENKTITLNNDLFNTSGNYP